MRSSEEMKRCALITGKGGRRMEGVTVVTLLDQCGRYLDQPTPLTT